MDFDEHIQRAMAFFDKKDYASTIEEFEAALEIDPDKEETLRGPLESVKQLAQVAAEYAAMREEEALARAMAFGFDVDDVDEVIEDNTKAYRANPNDAAVKELLVQVHYIRGLLYQSRNELDEAIGDFDMAISYDPDYLSAYNRRGEAHKAKGNYDQAIEDYKMVLRGKTKPYDIEERLGGVYCDRGYANQRNGNYEQAAMNYKMALKFNPDNSDYRELLEKAEKALNSA
jgi:tetratricopeptide (TPR) repeat protein